MMSLSRYRKALAATSLSLCAILSLAGGRLNSEAAGVLRLKDPTSSKQLATLQSYLMTDKVTVGIIGDDQHLAAVQRGLAVWDEAISDSPFVMAGPGEKPMISVRFVNTISSDDGGDTQGQIEATRYLHWGTNVSYKLEANLQVCHLAGRRELRDDEITEVVAHELGHILGLDDADDCSGLMGYFVPGRPRMKPTEDERKSVIRYRAQLREAISRVSLRN
jgi:hypothetical protein